MITFTKLGLAVQLGNELFQYAYLRSMANKLGVQFYCPSWSGDLMFDLKDQSIRALQPDKMNIYYQEPKKHCGFDPNALDILDNTDVSGYFQSEQYYVDHDEIRTWYTFNEKTTPIRKQFKAIDFSKSVSLSLRINDDYNDLRNRYPLYRLSYYKNALKRVKHKNHILIFSDRPERARIFFKDLKQDNIIFVEGSTAAQDLYLMSLCHDNIITNSTFSWWGAWLNKHDDKTVIIPKPWFRPGSGYTATDISCNGWTQINALNPILDHYLMWRCNRKKNHLLAKFNGSYK